jgi:hypothetical protein
MSDKRERGPSVSSALQSLDCSGNPPLVNTQKPHRPSFPGTLKSSGLLLWWFSHNSSHYLQQEHCGE